MSIFAFVQTASGIASLRDLTPADLPAIIAYWLLMPDEDLVFMGVDRKLLGSEEDIQRRFSNSIRTGDPSQPAISFGMVLDEKLVGYTLLNRQYATETSPWAVFSIE